MAPASTTVSGYGGAKPLSWLPIYPAWIDHTRLGNRKKWVLGGLIAIIIAIIVTIILGVVLSRKSSSSSSSDDIISGDPSQFTKDSSLKRSFWGIAYTPKGTLYPDCGAKLSDVVTDIQLLSQLTARIRVYGADCNTTALVAGHGISLKP
ncbi:hypothetical protein GGU11DRAFT_746604 [Lentinula aff. detonsa]|nr:hypothetical protein GGU11DRAFT_746604 [Lentinula aff. detonsa]